MSGVGKSYWSKKLAKEYGFLRISCDDLIEQQISKNVSSNNENLKSWMGLPGSENFLETQKTYMSLENQIMRETLVKISKDSSTDYVIDTTGSIIYCETDILKNLRALSKIVYLESSKTNFDSKAERFIKNPCPLIIWGGMFQPRPDEKYEQSLKRCYLKLFESRIEHYESLFEFKISDELHKSPNFSSEEFLKLISCDEILQHQ